jgi:hypothetical protein
MNKNSRMSFSSFGKLQHKCTTRSTSVRWAIGGSTRKDALVRLGDAIEVKAEVTYFVFPA